MNLILKEKILKSGFKQQFIAGKADIDNVRLSKIIHGHVEPTSEEKEAIAKALNESCALLFPLNVSDS